MSFRLEHLQQQNFGKLTVLRLEPDRRNSCRVWRCLCECGNISFIRSRDLYRAKSCGCVGKHYESHTRLYSTWHNIKQKCTNSYSEHYRAANTLQDDWRRYPAFRSWALGNGYDDSKRIKRKIIENGFNALNCEWR